ncbi:MAG TPA: hypothetical protein VJZ71_00455 [Phycisphaerae bacterium]|nr:hypothetical protein [Phycisphaerae bacterium]
MKGPEHILSTAVPRKREGEPGVLRAVKIGEPSYRFVFVVVATLIVIVLIGVPFRWRATSKQWIVVAIAGGVLFVVFLRVWGSLLQRRIANAIRQSTDESAETIVQGFLKREFASSTSYPTACLEFVKALASRGRIDETFLLLSKTPCPEIDPINESFEAKLLDESDGAFEELDAALSGNEKRIEETAERMRQSQGDTLSLRRIKRNMKMNGGRWLVGVYLFTIFVQMIESWQQKRVTGLFLLQTTYLLLFLLVPHGMTWWKPQQWWAVPGGLVHRWSGLFDRKSKVHLFNRRNSVLCVYEGWRHTWLLAVADQTQSAMRSATVSEVNFLLHAWLSPLHPPPVEKLVDLQ